MEPLLMIPGPIELSPAVKEAASQPPPSHTAPRLIAAFGNALRGMRQVWKAGEGAQPFAIAGSGTLAMEMAATNLLDPGQPVLVVNHGYFADRMATMLERRGARVHQVAAEPGHTVPAEQVEAALGRSRATTVFITHVDTSTGVRADVPALAAAAHQHGAMVVVDGVCSTVGEALDQAALGVDVFLTGSQKAIGVPPGLALLVASPRALEARRRLMVPPPLTMDFESWMPIMQAYEEGRPSYFGTPATSLILALEAGLAELLDQREGNLVGIEAAWATHARVAGQLRAAWRVLGCGLLPASEGEAANTLSAIRYPHGRGPFAARRNRGPGRRGGRWVAPGAEASLLPGGPHGVGHHPARVAGTHRTGRRGRPGRIRAPL